MKTRLARLDWRHPPTWLLGLLLAVLTWNVQLAPPSVGLDASWIAGISMATHAGLHYGTEFVFSYGPLGFVVLPLAFYGGFGLFSLLYLCALYIGLCVILVWALRRHLPGWLALVLGFALLGLLPLIEEAPVVATLVALALLEKERPPWVLNLYVALAPTYAAVEALAKLSTGPVIAIVLILGLIGARPSRAQVAAFFALFVGQLAIFWFATGQALSNIGPFIHGTVEVAGGYSTAMMRLVDVPTWQVTLATAAAAALSLALVAIVYRLPFGDRRTRWCATLLTAVSAFALYKEGVVRPDAGHLSLYFSSACIIWIGLPWQRGRWLIAGAVAIALIGIPMRPKETPTNYGVIGNVELAGEQVANLVDPGKRDRLIEGGREAQKYVYALQPDTLAALEGHTVSVEPWETGAVWAYGFDWSPTPVFQNYSAYTSHLDRLNSEAIESPDGPERILRENPPQVYDEFPTPDLDGRFAGWDPPEQMRTVLCHFRPLVVSVRWEVLGRTADRCGAPRLVESVDGKYGETIQVPTAGKGEVVYVKIDGAEVGGLEKLTNFLLHARIRHILVNGVSRYRLVPETAADGLLVSGDPKLVEEEGGYSPIAQTQTIEVEGPGGDLSFDFYAMKVAAQPKALVEPAP